LAVAKVAKDGETYQRHGGLMNDSRHSKLSKLQSVKRPMPPRSTRQKVQARQNGAKSKGPKTAGGKDISRGNALQHGLTAKVLITLPNGRNDDQLFAELVERLREQYSPGGVFAFSFN
jgi:hypothetical protein